MPAKISSKKRYSKDTKLCDKEDILVSKLNKEDPNDYTPVFVYYIDSPKPKMAQKVCTDTCPNKRLTPMEGKQEPFYSSKNRQKEDKKTKSIENLLRTDMNTLDDISAQINSHANQNRKPQNSRYMEKLCGFARSVHLYSCIIIFFSVLILYPVVFNHFSIKQNQMRNRNHQKSLDSIYTCYPCHTDFSSAFIIRQKDLKTGSIQDCENKSPGETPK